MDQQTMSPSGLAYHRQTLPYGLAGLSLSVAGIAVAAVVFCCFVTIVAVVLFVAQNGTEATTEFFQDLRFDFPLQSRLRAGVVSSLYIGVGVATCAIAWWRGGRDCLALLALTSGKRAWRGVLLIAIVTLAYAAIVTWVITHMQNRHLAIEGPTDVVLLATALANLVILAPLAEEVLFRGWLFTGLRRAIGPWPGGLVTAILFAAIHYDANHRRFFLVLPLAISLGVVREVSGSIRPTIALHAIYNLIIVAITLATV